MGQQNVAIWIAILPAIMMAMAPLLMAKKNPQREKALDNYARKVNLALTPAVRPRVIARLRSYEKSALIGGGIGVAIGLPVMIIVNRTDGVHDWSDSLPLAIIISLALGASYGPVVTSVRQALRPTPGRRIARPSAPRISDYVPTLERISAPAGIAGAAVALIGGIVLLSTGLLPSDSFSVTGLLLSPGALIGYLAVLTWIAGVIVERLLLRTGQVAETEQELAWDDALRSMTLRGVALLPSVVSSVATMLIFFDVVWQVTTASDLMTTLGVLAMFGYLGIVGAGITADAIRKPAQHYWRQLWEQRTEQSA